MFPLKVVVFATHLKVIDALCKTFGEIAVRVTGETKTADRATAVERFQTDDSIRVFVGSTRAAGQGVTPVDANVPHPARRPVPRNAAKCCARPSSSPGALGPSRCKHAAAHDF